MNIGFINFGILSKKKNLFWEIQLFARTRRFSDGITFFKFNINWDRYESDHTPAFQFELTIFNLYNHLWIYKSNPIESE